VPSARDIRRKIRSVQSTQKITRAMEMVAASKMRRAQERVAHSRPYAHKIREVIGHVAQAQTEYVHPYMRAREPRRIGLIVISTDRGLAGGLNANLFRTVVQQLRAWEHDGLEAELVTVGSKGGVFFRRLGCRIVGEASHLGDTPALADLIGAVSVMLQAYDEERIDRLYLAYNEFVNTMTQRPTLTQVVPLPAGEALSTYQWDYLYEPAAETVLDALLRRYVESMVYQGVVENAASEQAARMVAMKAASDNAGTLIEELQLIYNKARQAAITKELAEIVAGAEAV
jgi:F-type H+-transporting ATPase subunit gamma